MGRVWATPDTMRLHIFAVFYGQPFAPDPMRLSLFGEIAKKPPKGCNSLSEPYAVRVCADSAFFRGDNPKRGRGHWASSIKKLFR
jgi:hypothetical protein